MRNALNSYWKFATLKQGAKNVINTRKKERGGKVNN
jgi:hypothetical protein